MFKFNNQLIQIYYKFLKIRNKINFSLYYCSFLQNFSLDFNCFG